VQPGRGLGFAQGPPDARVGRIGRTGAGRRQIDLLDRHVTAEQRVLRLPDRTHPALTQRPQQAIAAYDHPRGALGHTENLSESLLKITALPGARQRPYAKDVSLFYPPAQRAGADEAGTAGEFESLAMLVADQR